MLEVNKIISIISLLIILLVGIGVVSGLLLQTETKMRIGIGVIVAVYCSVRLYLLLKRPRRKSLLQKKLRLNGADSGPGEKA
jgi:hypothetical protein